MNKLYDKYIPAHLPVTPEVQAVEDDFNAITEAFDGKNCPLNTACTIKFKKHRNNLLPLAENGDALAQYKLGIIYWLGYLHESEAKAIEHHQEDLVNSTKWLILAAKQGVIVALDNL